MGGGRVGGKKGGCEKGEEERQTRGVKEMKIQGDGSQQNSHSHSLADATLALRLESCEHGYHGVVARLAADIGTKLV